MSIFTSIFLVAGLILSVLIGPQTRPWTWGPAMLLLGISAASTLPGLWKKGLEVKDFGFVVLGGVTMSWFAWRAHGSPVAELGQADLLLLAGAAAAFFSMRGCDVHGVAGRIVIWGIALLLLANAIAIGMQVADPTFSPIIRSRASQFPSGFYGHYNEAANFLIGSSLIVAAAALLGNEGKFTRFLWLLIAIAGLAAVYFTRSRGGILAAAVGTGILVIMSISVAHRRGARWFGPLLIAIPLIGLGISAYLFSGWDDSQELRHAAAGNILDNDCRLYFMGIALTCISTHPWLGGGSQSFSWESLQILSQDLMGAVRNKPEMVHNELLQAATDYGLIGAGLLIGLLTASAFIALLAIFLPETPEESSSDSSWHVGGIAGLSGMFVQSCFSFVFHLLPGIVLLGICLGASSRSTTALTPSWKGLVAKSIQTLAILACLFLLIPAGWKGSQVMQILWPTYFSKASCPSDDSSLDALAKAIQIWPQAEFHKMRAMILHRSFSSAFGSQKTAMARAAMSEFQKAGELNPNDPSHFVNQANLLSYLKQDADAELTYHRAIQLQGGMESGYRGHFYLASHYFNQGRRSLFENKNVKAREAFEKAATEIELAAAQSPPHVMGNEGRLKRISIHDNLGSTRENAGNLKGAMESYRAAASIPSGEAVHYREGVLLSKTAKALLQNRQPGEALGYFIEARRRISMAPGLPERVTPLEKSEFTKQLDQTINSMKEAKIEAVPYPETPR
ncbi:MAG: O-antigen ligase family protein [Akkermansiaceae bacterium]|nr:O-antigen ligase family protein [Akkermansiaceae bacterium]